ncbi:MAG: hypothetical protein P8N76_18180 [Pirellulaceae bacterium]|nr:hypothetical protein [Pirellulaceae bacterium]
MTFLMKYANLLLFVALLASPIQSQAAIAISELIESGGSVVSGDKKFDEFSFSSTGDMPPASEVGVDPITDFYGDYGIRLFGAFIDHPGGGASQMNVGYRVTTLDPEMQISGSLLQGNPTAIRSGSVVITSTMSGKGELEIFDQIPGSTKAADEITFDSSVSELDVAVQLVGDATGDPSAITVSFIDQTFSQSVVPEPASVAVWLGMAFLVCVVPALWRRPQLLMLKIRK